MQFIGEGGKLLAVATNSEQVKVFDRSTLDCRVLAGHSGIVLCLDVSEERLLATSSKDNTVRLWRLGGRGQFDCVAIGTGHTHAVGAVALSRYGPIWSYLVFPSLLSQHSASEIGFSLIG